MTLPIDPESEGLPDSADDESSAYDEHDRPRFDSSATTSGDEPMGVDEYGVTAEESSHDAPMNRRLWREEKDISPDDPETPRDRMIAEEATTEDDWAQASLDADVLNDDSVTDVYEPRPVGRLIDADYDGLNDTEAESIAFDTGEIEGQSAEESAMHEISGDEVPYR